MFFIDSVNATYRVAIRPPAVELERGHLSIYLYLFHRNHTAQQLTRTMEQDEQG